jgi:pyruvate carboxylase subunit B
LKCDEVGDPRRRTGAISGGTGGMPAAAPAARPPRRSAHPLRLRLLRLLPKHRPRHLRSTGSGRRADGTPLNAPMPGMIVSYQKNVGDTVEKGDTVSFWKP